VNFRTLSARRPLFRTALALAMFVAVGACGDSKPAGGVDVLVDSGPGGDQGGVDVVADLPVADVGVLELPPADADPDTGDGEGCEGCFGSPCESNTDCFSGWCVDGPTGGTCTKLCEAACPTDWACKGVSSGGDPQFICIWVHQPYCRPCRADGDCGHPLASGFANRCVERPDGSGSYCATECQAEGSCPTGATCGEPPGGGDPRCLPTSGQCECAAQHIEAGASTDCYVDNAFGTCTGSRACTVGGLSACSAATPAEELCNGEDDDCDGATDEPYDLGGESAFVSETGVELALGASCSEGACGSGVVVCGADEVSVVCTGTGAGTSEICNGKDDDCDGFTDEDFKAGGSVTLADLDGTTGLVLGDACGVGACAGGEVVCAASAVALGCSTHGAAAAEVCNLDDDDCNGVADDGLVVKNDLAKLAAAGCATDGVCGLKDVTTAACVDGAWGCIYDSPFYEPEELSCDNRDNDCDGNLDELPTTLDADTLAAIGCLNQGVCAVPGSTTATCSNGTWSCLYGHPGYQVVETRCDGFDNDCNGATDPDGIEEAQEVHPDADTDGFGNPDVTAKQCFVGAGFVKNDDDCYGDQNTSVNPDHQSWETTAHAPGNFDWNCDKKAEQRHTSVVGKCKGTLSADLEHFSLCVPTSGDAEGWRAAPAACGTTANWHEGGDCTLKNVFDNLSLIPVDSIESDEDATGLIEIDFLGIKGYLAACTWEAPTPRAQECR
jgi:hypothetical protein